MRLTEKQRYLLEHCESMGGWSERFGEDARTIDALINKGLAVQSCRERGGYRSSLIYGYAITDEGLAAIRK